MTDETSSKLNVNPNGDEEPRLDANPDENKKPRQDANPDENKEPSDENKKPSDENKKPRLKVVAEEELDADEKEFRALRRDLPGVKGASAIGIVNIGVAKNPGKNEFFRTLADFRPVFPVIDLEVGMEKQFFVATDAMVVSLAAIGITVSNHTLYLTMTSRGAYRIVPVRCAGEDGDQNEYARTKEIGLREGIERWVRIYTDQENRCYKVFPAPDGRYADPIWPELKPAKIFRLAFRDKGRLIDSPQHPLFLKWAARDSDPK